jgi:hypothetical protein
MRDILRQPEARQLLRNIASFRASLSELRGSATLDECFCCLADAIESYGWIGAGASPPHAAALFDAFGHVDTRLAAIEPEDPEIAFPGRLALWRVAERMGLLLTKVRGGSPDPIAELVYSVAEGTGDRYLRLGLAWSLHARLTGPRELNLLFMAFRDAKLYPLEERYRDRHRQLRPSHRIVLSNAEQQRAIQLALEFTAPGRIGLPEIERHLRSLHVLLLETLKGLQTGAVSGRGRPGARLNDRARGGAAFK